MRVSSQRAPLGTTASRPRSASEPEADDHGAAEPMSSSPTRPICSPSLAQGTVATPSTFRLRPSRTVKDIGRRRPARRWSPARPGLAHRNYSELAQASKHPTWGLRRTARIDRRSPQRQPSPPPNSSTPPEVRYADHSEWTTCHRGWPSSARFAVRLLGARTWSTVSCEVG